MNLRHSILSASLLILGVAASVMASTSVSEAGSKPVEVRKPVITKPKFDPSAERVEFFKGMEDGQLETRFVPKDANGGFLLVTNTSEEPITVDLPDAFVAVQVLKQFGGGGMGGGGRGGGGMGGGGLGGPTGSRVDVCGQEQGAPQLTTDQSQQRCFFILCTVLQLLRIPILTTTGYPV